MRDAIIDRQLDHLWVDEHELHLIRAAMINDARDDGIDAHALAAAGRACDQKMRGFRQIGHDRLPGDVLSQGHKDVALAMLKGIAGKHIMKRHRGRLRIRDLDADRRFSGDRGFDADMCRLKRHGELIRKSFDLAHADAHFRLELETRHRRPHAVVNDLRPDSEAGKRRLDECRLLSCIGLSLSRTRSRMKKRERRKLIHRPRFRSRCGMSRVC